MNKIPNQGQIGEKLAEAFCIKKGLKILEKNYRFGKHEIDLIAELDGLLIFIEVKARWGLNYGVPERAVTKTKQNSIKKAAQAYIEKKGHLTEIRFDIIAIVLEKTQNEIVHFEDAFF